MNREYAVFWAGERTTSRRMLDIAHTHRQAESDFAAQPILPKMAVALHGEVSDSPLDDRLIGRHYPSFWP